MHITLILPGTQLTQGWGDLTDDLTFYFNSQNSNAQLVSIGLVGAYGPKFAPSGDSVLGVTYYSDLDHDELASYLSRLDYVVL